jgi:hypothetical protein
MGLRASAIKAHIEHWSGELAHGDYNFRANWPAYLYRHEPVENAAKILRDGVLLSRSLSSGIRPRDIAGSEVISADDRAHGFARLYFRPRNPTQYHVEGVRKRHEYWRNESNAHAPVLIMLLFDARKILTLDNVEFSDGNMQSIRSTTSKHEKFFQNIDFGRVYHYGNLGGDRDLIRARCAEILVPGRLRLDGFLRHVMCRSQAERQTLIHALGSEAPRWSSKISVSNDTTVFEKTYTYVESVVLHPNRIVFRLKPRPDRAEIKFAMRVLDLEDDSFRIHGPFTLAATPPSGGAWFVKQDLTGRTYRVQVKLEDCLAYDSVLNLTEGPL